MRAVEAVEDHPQRRAPDANQRVRQHARHGPHARHQPVLDGVPHDGRPRLPAAGCRRAAPSAGWPVAGGREQRRDAVEQHVRRIEAKRQRHAIQRERAGAGVLEPHRILVGGQHGLGAGLAHRVRDARDVARGEGVVIAEQHLARHHIPGLRHVLDKALRVGNAARDQDPGTRRQGSAPGLESWVLSLGSRGCRGLGLRLEAWVRANQAGLAQHSLRATGEADTERPALGGRGAGRRAHHDQHVRASGGVLRLAQPARRQHAAARDFSRCRHQHVEIARQAEMLKPVVQQVHGGAELPLGEHARQVAIRAHADDGAGHRARQHQAARRRTGRARPAPAWPSDDHHHAGHRRRGGGSRG